MAANVTATRPARRRRVHRHREIGSSIEMLGGVFALGSLSANEKEKSELELRSRAAPKPGRPNWDRHYLDEMRWSTGISVPIDPSRARCLLRLLVSFSTNQSGPLALERDRTVFAGRV